MSEIRVGDLVMVVRPRLCCGAGRTGLVFTVREISTAGALCWECGQRTDVAIAKPVEFNELQCGIGCGCELSRLKKIPPLTEPESIEQRDEVHV